MDGFMISSPKKHRAVFRLLRSVWATIIHKTLRTERRKNPGPHEWRERDCWSTSHGPRLSAGWGPDDGFEWISRFPFPSSSPLPLVAKPTNAHAIKEYQ